jgi:hypothetical protein
MRPAPEADNVLPLLLREEPLSLRDLGDFLRQPVGPFFGSASAYGSRSTIR